MMPYRSRKPCPSKVSPQSDAFPNTAKAYGELLLLNENLTSSVPTYDHFRRCWGFIPLPQRTTSSGTVDITPTGLRSMYNSAGAPSSEVYCPHMDKKGSRFLGATIRVDGDYNGRKATYFQCSKDHKCDFKILVRTKPTARKSEVLTTWDQIQRFNDRKEVEDNGAMPPKTATQDDPRRPFHSVSSQRSPPTPRHATSAKPTLRPFFQTSVALARADSDHDLISRLQEEQYQGRYRRSPDNHPLAGEHEGNLPYVMQAYDQNRHPDCSARTFSNLQFFTTELGFCIRRFVSTIGITLSDFSNIIRHCTGCRVCCCTFSFDGYNAHIQDGHCRNLVQGPLEELPTVAKFRPPPLAVTTFTRRTYYKNQEPAHSEEALDSPTALALLEWNSPLGIPTDMWMTICTGYVGLCADIGQAKNISDSQYDSD
ncbi:hypothetical protein C8J57DRAFT_1236206 [Mycena rebaudengoi]|nr:hypothetical protein C8J57DRAFT_1236206 [Mycena rebaudengoi]